MMRVRPDNSSNQSPKDNSFIEETMARVRAKDAKKAAIPPGEFDPLPPPTVEITDKGITITGLDKDYKDRPSNDYPEKD
jgi:hypothetical protein